MKLMLALLATLKVQTDILVIVCDAKSRPSKPASSYRAIKKEGYSLKYTSGN
jgi:hypothetical protein